MPKLSVIRPSGGEGGGSGSGVKGTWNVTPTYTPPIVTSFGFTEPVMPSGAGSAFFAAFGESGDDITITSDFGTSPGPGFFASACAFWDAQIDFTTNPNKRYRFRTVIPLMNNPTDDFLGSALGFGLIESAAATNANMTALVADVFTQTYPHTGINASVDYYKIFFVINNGVDIGVLGTIRNGADTGDNWVAPVMPAPQVSNTVDYYVSYATDAELLAIFGESPGYDILISAVVINGVHVGFYFIPYTNAKTLTPWFGVLGIDNAGGNSINNYTITGQYSTAPNTFTVDPASGMPQESIDAIFANASELADVTPASYTQVSTLPVDTAANDMFIAQVDTAFLNSHNLSNVRPFNTFVMDDELIIVRQTTPSVVIDVVNTNRDTEQPDSIVEKPVVFLTEADYNTAAGLDTPIVNNQQYPVFTKNANNHTKISMFATNSDYNGMVYAICDSLLSFADNMDMVGNGKLRYEFKTEYNTDNLSGRGTVSLVTTAGSTVAYSFDSTDDSGGYGWPPANVRYLLDKTNFTTNTAFKYISQNNILRFTIASGSTLNEGDVIYVTDGVDNSTATVLKFIGEDLPGNPGEYRVIIEITAGMGAWFWEYKNFTVTSGTGDISGNVMTSGASELIHLTKPALVTGVIPSVQHSEPYRMFTPETELFFWGTSAIGNGPQSFAGQDTRFNVVSTDARGYTSISDFHKSLPVGIIPTFGENLLAVLRSNLTSGISDAFYADFSTAGGRRFFSEHTMGRHFYIAMSAESIFGAGTSPIIVNTAYFGQDVKAAQEQFYAVEFSTDPEPKLTIRFIDRFNNERTVDITAATIANAVLEPAMGTVFGSTYMSTFTFYGNGVDTVFDVTAYATPALNTTDNVSIVVIDNNGNLRKLANSEFDITATNEITFNGYMPQYLDIVHVYYDSYSDLLYYTSGTVEDLQTAFSTMFTNFSTNKKLAPANINVNSARNTSFNFGETAWVRPNPDGFTKTVQKIKGPKLFLGDPMFIEETFDPTANQELQTKVIGAHALITKDGVFNGLQFEKDSYAVWNGITTVPVDYKKQPFNSDIDPPYYRIRYINGSVYEDTIAVPVFLNSELEITQVSGAPGGVLTIRLYRIPNAKIGDTILIKNGTWQAMPWQIEAVNYAGGTYDYTPLEPIIIGTPTAADGNIGTGILLTLIAIRSNGRHVWKAEQVSGL